MHDRADPRGEPTGPSVVYTQRGNTAFEDQMARRTAAEEGAFFLPHLRAGMALLDAGCGPGSITLGLAAAVDPGEVLGIDIEPTQVERARAEVAERGVANARFQVADVYQVPVADRTFDAVFANGVLMHLREPVRALRELRRVLRPGGIVGLREPDFDTQAFEPTTPVLERWLAARIRVGEHNGVGRVVGRRLRGFLHESGFARAEATVSPWVAGSPEETRRYAAFFKAQLPGIARTALAQGWLDRATADAIPDELDAWAERPDAFFAMIWCAAIGWADLDARPAEHGR